MSKIDMNKTYRTRDGREVRIYSVDAGGTYPIHGSTEHDDGWSIQNWTSDGRCYSSQAGGFDLIEVKPRINKTVWANVYPDGGLCFHMTRESADHKALVSFARRIACVKVEIDCEEGEGLP